MNRPQVAGLHERPPSIPLATPPILTHLAQQRAAASGIVPAVSLSHDESPQTPIQSEMRFNVKSIG
jgi:hypothetical protein